MDFEFPYAVGPGGRTATAGRDAHVRDLIEQVLFTMPGERVMRPGFGCGLAELVFQPSSAELGTAVQFLVQGSLQQWLGEVLTVEAVDASSGGSTIDVRVQYTVRGTGQRRTDVFSREL